MPSLRKRKLKSGATYWDIRYRVDGIMKVRRIGETDRRTAEKIYHEFCSALAAGESDGMDSPPSMLLSELAERSRTFALSNKSKKTGDREATALRTLINAVGDLRIDAVTPMIIEEYKVRRLTEVSPHTLNLELRVLNTALQQAKKLKLIPEAAPGRFQLVRTRTPDPPAWLTKDQIKLLLSHPDPLYRRFLIIGLKTGCRRNEVLGLQWSDIDLPRRQIVVRGETGKMGKRRTVPISDTLAELFIKWPGERSGLLFPDYKPDSVSQKFRRWARQISLPPDIHLHSLRATFACHLIEKGVDIYTVSRLLGHSSVKVTEKHYLALNQEHVRTAVNHLDFDTDV
ncbi:site-specific integrase [bacterium]|nr:site-specific integrase [bacterium]